MANDEFVIPRRLINSDREETPRSLLDLIEQGPFDLDTAAWWMSHVANGASWIVGSGPGGIGKSTTMRSFLSVVSGDRAFAIAMPGEIAPLADHQKRCTIALELSDHRPPGYLWDQDLRDFFNLSKVGHQLVGNVHADTVEETREQIVGACSVPEEQFHHINIIAFVWLEGYERGHSGRTRTCVTSSTYRRWDISLWGTSTRIRWKRRVNRSSGRAAFPRNSSITSTSSHSSGWKVMNADTAGGSGIRRRGGF
jgi:hypothetical protein